MSLRSFIITIQFCIVAGLMPYAGELHPGWSIEEITIDDYEFSVGGMDWLPDGRLVLCDWGGRKLKEGFGKVYIIDGVNDSDPSSAQVVEFADGLHHPLGVTVVDGEIYVVQNGALLHLQDKDGNGKADFYRVVANGWDHVVNYHNFGYGLLYKDGWFYMAQGRHFKTHQALSAGAVIRIPKDGDGEWEYFAGGLREPNGWGIGPENALFVTDNEGEWNPSGSLRHIQQGKHYGHKYGAEHPYDLETRTPPSVWLPHGEVGRSNSQPILIRHGKHRGQMIVLDYKRYISRVHLEKVNGQFQGCVFMLSNDNRLTKPGHNRLVWGSDNTLIMGGIGNGAGGSWGSDREWGLYRLKENGNEVFEMSAIRMKSADLMEIEFSHPIAAEVNPRQILQVSQFQYIPTEEYGGDELNRELLSIEDIQISQDRKLVTVRIPGLKKNYVAEFSVDRDLKSDGDLKFWNQGTVAWYTVNQLGTAEEVTVPVNRNEIFTEVTRPNVMLQGNQLIVTGLGAAISTPVLLDLQGREIAKLQKINSSGSWLLTKPGTGVYMIQYQSAKGLMKTHPLPVH